MRIDLSPAERFLSYADGETSLADVWDHPAYEVARNHAALLGTDLTREDVSGAMDGERTAFSDGEDLSEHRDRIARLIDHVRSNRDEWTDVIERELSRITPDADLSDVPVFLAIGYEFGVGLKGGAYVNLNEPLFHGSPRQLLSVAIHESSHVVYDRVHDFSAELGPDRLDSRAGQRATFETLFHTEAYATYTPLALRRSDGNLGTHDHPVCRDYRVLSDDAELRRLVRTYDSFRESLRDGPVSRESLFEHLFGGSRVPYRVGCVLLEGIERERGVEAVRDGFYADAGTFLERNDWVLDRYRDPPAG